MISSAIHIGRHHRLMNQNCHDFAIAGTTPSGSCFGIVLDGCGSKTGNLPPHTEVGAKLLGTFAAQWWQGTLENGSPLAEQFVLFQTACLSFLRQLVEAMPFIHEGERDRFVASHLLCTLVGFVIEEKTAGIFWAGDGYYQINDQIIQLESQNQPNYLAYQLYHHSPQPFQTLILSDVAGINCLAVATDGWQPTLLSQLPAAQSPLSLQRWLNQQAQQGGNFEDDGAVAIWWRTKP